jgi:hypothetical protein
VSKLKDVFKNTWAWIAGIFAVVVGLFLWEKSKRKSAESKLQVADAEKESAVLDERKAQTKKEIEEEAELQRKLEEARNKSREESKNESLSDVVDFLNKNRK